MPHYFACPACKQKNYGQQSAPAGQQYRYGLRCARCGKRGIYWVADAGTRDLLIEQKHVSAEDIAVGSGTSNIRWMEPEAPSGDTFDGIVNLLKGNATFVAAYSQGVRTKEFKDRSRIFDKVEEGQCEGQCLHWIRRVLQGGRETYRVEPNKGATSRGDWDIREKQMNQHFAGAIAQAQREKSLGTRNPQLDEITRYFTERRKAAGFTLSGDGKTWTYLADQEARWVAMKQQEKAALDAANVTGFYGHSWEKLKVELDRQLKGAEAMKQTSKRPFSNIVATKSLNRTPYASTAGFVKVLMADGAFKAKTCALLGIGLRVGRGEAGGEISGHAIAVHWKSDIELFLFDPNIGVFSSGNKAALGKALEDLVGLGWSQVLEWELDGTYGYSLFEWRGSETDVQPREKPMLVSPSDVATGLENKVAGVVPLKIPVANAAPSSNVASRAQFFEQLAKK
jgi:hypothetical protein